MTVQAPEAKQFQAIFERREQKYLLTGDQRQRLLALLQPHLTADRYARTTVRSVYYDTPTRLLIRRSLEKPPYKEKLRLRSYGLPEEDDKVFAELKKKYCSVVYKRRLALPRTAAEDWLTGRAPCPVDTQISSEIEYVRRLYAPLVPSVLLSYERQAFVAVDCAAAPELRVTLDDSILWRTSDLTLGAPVFGTPLLSPDVSLMEIKCEHALPLWLTHALGTVGIYQTSFSKYGSVWQLLSGAPCHPLVQSCARPEAPSHPTPRQII